MKAISESIYERGKHGTKYLRLRIPVDVRPAYSPQLTHITLSLGTSDLQEAKVRARSHRARLDVEFEHARQRLAARQGALISRQVGIGSERGQLAVSAGAWASQALKLQTNQTPAGAAEAAGSAAVPSAHDLQERLAECARDLGQERALWVLTAFKGFVRSVGLPCDLGTQVSHVANRAFLEALSEQVRAVGSEGGMTQAGKGCAEAAQRILEPLSAPSVPSGGAAAVGDGRPLPGWEDVFAIWRDFVIDRPRSTAIAAQTPWRDLRKFMDQRVTTPPCKSPAEVASQDMTAFAQDMRSRGLAVDTINERLFKIKAIYKIAVGRHLLSENPAQNTLGFKESSVQKRRKRRLPFDQQDLQLIFGSEVFTQHRRSSGQSGEASYWIPILLFYTGARPEEVAGMALQDIKQHPSLGWYFDIVDRPSGEDRDLFAEVPASHRRTLKNGQSIRRVPVAQQLIDLGLLRYVEGLRAQGKTVLFPTLKKDWHGKLSGAFSKFFGRYKRALGIRDERKVMYSFRHSMKDILEQAGLPSKYLQRLLGHTSGDGAITDGYGSDVPFDLVVSHFRSVVFPQIPAKPWEAGRGPVRLLRGDGED